MLRALLEERMEGLVAELERRPDRSGVTSRPSLTARVARMLHYVGDAPRLLHRRGGARRRSGASSSSATVPGSKAGRTRHRAGARDVPRDRGGRRIAEGVLEPLDPIRLARVLGALFRAFSLGALEEGLPDRPRHRRARSRVSLFLRGAMRAKRGDAIAFLEHRSVADECRCSQPERTRRRGRPRAREEKSPTRRTSGSSPPR